MTQTLPDPDVATVTDPDIYKDANLNLGDALDYPPTTWCSSNNWTQLR